MYVFRYNADDGNDHYNADDGNELQNVESNECTEVPEDIKIDKLNVDEIESKSEESEDESTFPDVEIRISHSKTE